MFPMDHQLGPVAVEYDAPESQAQTAGRIVKHFTNAYAARCFYGVKSKQGHNPRVLRSETTMCPQVISEASVETTPAAAVKAPKAKKSPAKAPVAKVEKTKKTPATKAPAKAEKAPKAKAEPKEPKAKKEGLSKPQVRILQVLAKAKGPLSRKDLAEKAEVDATAIGSQVGYNNDEINARPVHAHNLINLKLVKFGAGEKENQAAFEITALGRKALEKANS